MGTACEQHLTFFMRAQPFHTVPLFCFTHVKPLRAVLCKNQAKWEMKSFHLPSNLHAIRYCGGMS